MMSTCGLRIGLFSAQNGSFSTILSTFTLRCCATMCESAKARNSVALVDGQSIPRYGCGKYLAAVLANRIGDSRLCLRLGQEHNTASATGAADFGGLGSGFARRFDQFFNQRCADPRSVGLAQLPLLAQQSRHFRPVGVLHSSMHGPRNLPNL